MINSVNVTPQISYKNTINAREIILPDELPRYSLNETLKQKDEFRKSVQKESNISNKSDKNFFYKALAIFAGIATFFALEKKNII